MIRSTLKWCRKNHHWILSCIAVIVISLNAKIYFRLTDAENRAVYCDHIRSWLFTHDDYVDRGARMWAAYSREPIDSVKKGWYPSVVELKSEVCVSLFPMGLGGEPVYCFDKKTKKPTYVSQDVE